MNRERRGAAAPIPSDRRAAQRYRAFGASAILGWHDASGFHTTTAALQDISLGGAALSSSASPRAGATVLVRLDGARVTDWIEATVVEVKKSKWILQAPRLIRLKFLAPCPYEFFTGAITGQRTACRPPHFRSARATAAPVPSDPTANP